MWHSLRRCRRLIDSTDHVRQCVSDCVNAVVVPVDHYRQDFLCHPVHLVGIQSELVGSALASLMDHHALKAADVSDAILD
jgi:hypothetical protein